MSTTTRPATTTTADAVVIGAGFAGLYMLKRLRDEQGLNVRVFEKGYDVGGTWFWNRYPGARCDAESIHYSFSFDPELDQEWTWTERFATQPEILSYLQHVADRYDLRKDITFNTTVTGASYDEDARAWFVTTDAGETVETTYLITAVGCLSASQIPDFEGLDDFAGEKYHTGQWPHEGVDFTGKRVAVIGTGSSGVQTIPKVAEQADKLFVLQRTPGFEIPAQNRFYTDGEMADIKARYPEIREANLNSAGGQNLGEPDGMASQMSDADVRTVLDRKFAEGGPAVQFSFPDALAVKEANDKVADYFRDVVRDTVDDPETAEKLVPADFPVFTKRLTVGTDYYETYNRDNVELVSLREQPIQRITRKGILVGEGDDAREIEVDAIVFATGYDAMTGPYTRMDIRGRYGLSISDKWASGPATFLGISTAGFPNYFMLTAPGSPSVLTNVVASIEQHVDWLSDYIRYMRDNGIETTEPAPEAEDKWVEHVNFVADQTLFGEAASWYRGANIPGKTQIFMPYAGGLDVYRGICDKVAADGYEGFIETKADAKEVA